MVRNSTIGMLVLFTAVAAPWMAGTAATAHARSEAQPLDDATVAAMFDEVNTADIWVARLGVKKGSSEQVRAFARMVVQDHEQVQQMARDMEKKQGINPTPPDNDRNAENLAKLIATLETKSGAEFDRMYILHEVEFHQAAVMGIKETLLPAIHNQEFKALIATVLPGFEHHREAVRELAKKLGYS